MQRVGRVAIGVTRHFRLQAADYAEANPPYELRQMHPTDGRALFSCVAFGNVFAQDALVPLQRPLVIRPVGEPVGNTDLPVDLTGSHGDSRLLTIGDDFLEA